MNIVRHPHSVAGVVVTSTNVMARNGRRIGGGLKNQRRGREEKRVEEMGATLIYRSALPIGGKKLLVEHADGPNDI